MKRQRWLSALPYFALAILLLIGAYLRLANLRTNPGWYPDEGSDLNIAWNLWQGRFQYFAVGGTLLVAARAPLFHLILAGLFSFFGYDILVARSVSAVAGLITIPLLYFTFAKQIGGWQALAASAFLAIFPPAVLYNRWGLTYNLLMPLLVLCFWSLLQLIETSRARWMFLAALTSALSILTAWAAVSLIICLSVVGWLYHRRSLIWALPLALSLPSVYLGITYVSAPAAFAQDLALTFSRSGGSILAQFLFASYNYTVFIASNYWAVLGIIGLFLIEPRRVRALVFLFVFVTLFFTLRFSVVVDLGLHRVVGLFPFFALGITLFLWRAISFTVRLVAGDLDRLATLADLNPRWSNRVLKLGVVPIFVFLVIADVVLFDVISDFLRVAYKFPTRIDSVLAVPPADAIQAIDYVNTFARPDDVVIASPQIGWAVHARAVDFQQTLSYDGFPTDNYPEPIAPSRFVFNPTPANARFAIVDRMWNIWAVENITSTKYLLDSVNQWPVAFQAGDYVVHRNPAR